MGKLDFITGGIKEFKDDFNIVKVWYAMVPMLVIWSLSVLLSQSFFLVGLLTMVTGVPLAKIGLGYYRTKEDPDFNGLLKGYNLRDFTVMGIVVLVKALSILGAGLLLFMVLLVSCVGGGCGSLSLLIVMSGFCLACILILNMYLTLVPYVLVGDEELTVVGIFKKTYDLVDEQYVMEYISLITLRLIVWLASIMLYGLPLIYFLPLLYILELRLVSRVLDTDEIVDDELVEGEISEVVIRDNDVNGIIKTEEVQEIIDEIEVEVEDYQTSEDIIEDILEDIEDDKEDESGNDPIVM